MRTTVVIDDRLLVLAKQEAAGRGLSLSELINEALRSALSRPVRDAARFSMPTFGDPAAPVHHEPADFAAEFERDDHSHAR